MKTAVTSLLLTIGLVLADNPYHQPPAPYHQSYCNPTEPPSCARSDYNGPVLSYCVDDNEYPVHDVAQQIEKDLLFQKKYSDVPAQSANDLVEHVTAYQEAAYDYSYYTGASKGGSPFDKTHWCGTEGYICPSTVDYAQIKRAINVENQWRVIVQYQPGGYDYGKYNYTQTTRLETCQTPGSACRMIAPCYNSACTQKYVFHRMLVLDPCDPYRGLFIDTFKLPSACSCHVPQH